MLREHFTCLRAMPMSDDKYAEQQQTFFLRLHGLHESHLWDPRPARLCNGSLPLFQLRELPTVGLPLDPREEPRQEPMVLLYLQEDWWR